jgi:hypothetical protein
MKSREVRLAVWLECERSQTVTLPNETAAQQGHTNRIERSSFALGADAIAPEHSFQDDGHVFM